MSFSKLRDLMHYPECWDTINYPSVIDGIKEIYSECHEDECYHRKG